MEDNYIKVSLLVYNMRVFVNALCNLIHEDLLFMCKSVLSSCLVQRITDSKSEGTVLKIAIRSSKAVP
jgi:hypothetical protein